VGDWVLMCGLMAIIASGWWTVHRIWSSGMDVTQGSSGSTQLLPSRSRAGANAARLPMATPDHGLP
jgi:hypothetical protein